MNEWLEVIWALVLAAVSGGAYAAYGYRNRPEGEPFSGPKLLRAVMWGLVIGLAMQAFDMDFINADALMHSIILFLFGIGPSLMLDQASIWLWKKLPESVRQVIKAWFSSSKNKKDPCDESKLEEEEKKDEPAMGGGPS